MVRPRTTSLGLWGGWGNDLLQADDDLMTGGGLNDSPDSGSPSLYDRAYGGAGLDILIANSQYDRLIDWVGEFNSFLVPFSVFGGDTISRQVAPGLPEFLYALGRSQGADATRTADRGGDLTRLGEPYGELGIVVQQDSGLWNLQAGAPSDPQPGTIPGGSRDVIQAATFNDGTFQNFAVDSGTWTISSGQLQVAAASLGKDTAAVWYTQGYLPYYFEITAKMSVKKPTSGWKANSFVLFDYWSPTDFKFAGIDVSINKMVIGRRTTAGWIYDAQGSVLKSLAAGTFYNVIVAVNGTNVTMSIGTQGFSYTFAPRTLPNGQRVTLNRGFIGFGSNNSQGVLDDIGVQTIPVQITLDRTSHFDDGVQLAGPVTGTWATSYGRLVGTPAGTGATDIATQLWSTQFLSTSSFVELDATIATSKVAGFVFDYYAPNDFKFVGLDVPGKRVIVGRMERRKGWVVQAVYARDLTAGVDYVLNAAVRGTSIVVYVNGSVMLTVPFNSAISDGRVGVFGRGGPVSVDRFRFRTSDARFTGAPAPQPEVRLADAKVIAPKTGTIAATLTLTLSAARTTATAITWRTLDGTARATTGDYVAVTSGTATIAAGATTATITVTVNGSAYYKPPSSFWVQVTGVGSGVNLARGWATVSITTASTTIAPAGTTTTTTTTSTKRTG